MLLLIALAVGGIVPVQTAANSRLRLSVGNRPIVSALISFSVALACAVLATLALVGDPVPHVPGGAPWWVWLGGVLGACFVMGNIMLFPVLGAVETVVLPILGQVAMGLLIDRFGLFHSPLMDVSVLRLIGAAVVFVGIVVTLRGGADVFGSSAGGPSVWIYRAVGVVIGMGSAAQTAINGHLGIITGSAYYASEINLTVGVALLLIAVLVTSPRQLTRRPEPGPWWMWLGGITGAIFVVAGASLSPILGTATTVIAFNAGTIAGGQLLETVGAFGARKSPLNARRVAGLVLIFAGILAVRLL
ncbi:DMT family transporter [Corynebacterium aquatimens]|uniref:Transporter family-2 protein n=1 Tax=Corynebacterium aquatimens TaxID=1190508 RepID=A0A931DXI0_9CORY|nr:DMT family transporter [Corynebacterium aquatimens]MBG6121925.1 transporter family-2 protein [Corynebacterium aquatimens]WJY65537.1 hypothetical protein CAQUA_04120 [Corynebacterium aquatimens]